MSTPTSAEKASAALMGSKAKNARKTALVEESRLLLEAVLKDYVDQKVQEALHKHLAAFHGKPRK